MWWFMWLSAGAVIGFVAATWILSGKVRDLQNQVDTKCENCVLAQGELRRIEIWSKG